MDGWLINFGAGLTMRWKIDGIQLCLKKRRRFWTVLSSNFGIFFQSWWVLALANSLLQQFISNRGNQFWSRKENWPFSSAGTVVAKRFARRRFECVQRANRLFKYIGASRSDFESFRSVSCFESGTKYRAGCCHTKLGPNSSNAEIRSSSYYTLGKSFRNNAGSFLRSTSRILSTSTGCAAPLSFIDRY